MDLLSKYTGGQMFQSVQVQRVHNAIARQIARSIVSGALAPGQQLPSETELTGEFGVSRAVVREALRSLAQRGLLEQSQGRRTVVLPIERWDVFDQLVLTTMREEGKIFPVLQDFSMIRSSLEPHVAFQAARSVTPELVASLEETLAEMERLATRHEGYYLADLDFHAGLALAAGSRVIYRLMKVIGTMFSQRRPLPGDAHEERIRAIAEHRAMLAAIAAGDAVEAERLMKDHVAWAAEGVYEMYSGGDKLTPVDDDSA